MASRTRLHARGVTGTCIACHKQKGGSLPVRRLDCHKKKQGRLLRPDGRRGPAARTGV